MSTTTVYAAGGVVWRQIEGKVRVLLVHRARYRDLTLPKGKLDPGETFVEAAVREIHEETGLRVTLGIPLGVSAYRLPNGRKKIVHYWAAEATGAALRTSSFRPNKEIDAIEWVSVKRARKLLSYPVDVDILDAFAARVDAGVLRTFPVIALRHAKALARTEWDGDDASRPLSPRGKRQANAIVGPLSAFGPRTIVSSPAVRCVRTVAPLAAALGRRVETTPAISQDAWEEGRADVRSVVDAAVRGAKPTVICSHGPVLPELWRALLEATGSMAHAHLGNSSSLETGAFSVAHLPRDHRELGVVEVELHVPRI